MTKIVLNPDAVKPAGATPECLIDKVELARRVGRKVRTVNHWMSRGLIPYLKIGQAVMFKWSDVEAHLHENFRVCRRNIPKGDTNLKSTNTKENQ